MHPLAEAYTGPMEAVLAEYTTIHTMELGFSDALDKAHAQVRVADDGLNEFAAKVSAVVLTLTGDDRSHALYSLFFGRKTLSEFKRPILGGQLDSMRKWGPSLDSSDHPALKALAPELPGLIDAADAAAAARGIAEQRKKEFREVGERRKYIDRVNAARRQLWVELSALPAEHVGLPVNFADPFFRRDAPAAEEAEEPTVESIEREIADLAIAIEAKQSALQALKDKAEEERLAAEALQAKEQQLLAMEQENAARLLEQEALRAEIEAARAA